MDYLSVKNWKKFQHYKDRTPPWIKLHRDLLNDYKFSCLQDASKLHLILIWLLSSQLENKIPNDPAWIARRINIQGTIDLNILIEYGFLEVLQDASSALAKRSPETEAYKEESEREEAPPKKKKTARRSRLSPDWKLTTKLRKYCQDKRPDLDPDETAEGFINYWLGDGRVKADWDRAFMTWVRNEKTNRANQNGTGKRETAVQARQRRARDAIERAERGEGITAPHSHGGYVAPHG
jgi:hypothetical protein